MRIRGSVLVKAPGAYETMELELDEPRQNEILVRMVASGLCHSDDHLATGDATMGVYPLCGGHEGAGIVEKVGPNTPGFEVDDHVVFSFLPSCGHCRWCASGMQNLCDNGVSIMMGSRPDDPTSFRMHTLDGRAVGQMCGISTFAEYTVAHVNSAVKVAKDMPLDRLCLLGCGVGTGWGSAVNSAQVQPGDTVVVMGVGGVGMNAVQGAAAAGAARVVAVDPVTMKTEAALKFGATHCFADIADALPLIHQNTNGQGADAVILTIGIVTGEHVAQAFSATRKGGTVVVTGMSTEANIPVPLDQLTLFQKRIQGSLFGASNPAADIPRQVDLYRQGKLLLDELVTTTYSIDQVAQGFDDMLAGKNIRGVVVYD